MREATAEGRVNHSDHGSIVYEEDKDEPSLRYNFKLWALLNEVGGYILMFPQDYSKKTL